MDSIETTPRTSTATTPQTEPEVLAGIESGEGQPREYDFTVSERAGLPGLVVLGAAGLLGFAASFGVSRYWHR